MILYHGSDVLVKKPEIRESKVCLDFGKGFYTTTSYEQAERWSRVKIRRNNKQFGYVSIFEFNIDAAKKSTTIRKFDSADMEWLMFVIKNRNGVSQEEILDMSIGPVADDNVYTSIRLYETGVLNIEETIKRLKTEVLHDQLTLHTDKILNYCKFIDYKKIQ